MIGPKLDARSYAILILAVFALLLGGSLIAQQQTRTTAETTAEVAAATRDVATATREVARSNEQIAQALRDLATSVREAGNAVASGNTAAAPPSNQGSAGDSTMAPGYVEPDKGTFEMRN